VYDLVDPEANLIFGAVIDPSITNGEVSITLIATGFGGTGREQQQALGQARGGFAMAASSNGGSNGSSTAAAAAAAVAQPSRAGLAPVPVEKPPVAQPRIRDDVPELGIEIPAFLRKRRARGQ
jgi:cell division protein FtsZ